MSRAFTHKANRKPAMNISSHRPYRERVKTNDREGSAKLIHYGNHMVVEAFTYVGGVHGSEFTSLKAYFGGETFSCKLPRYYHPRTLSGLSHAFDYAVYYEAKKRDLI